MEIKKCSVLTESEKKEILELENMAFKDEKLENHAFLSNEINFDKNLECFYMAYDNKKLIGFLTTFIPTSNEAEVLAVVHPEYRQKGCFNMLFQAAKEILLCAGIKNILLVIEAKSKSGLKALKKFEGCKLEHSEYRMFYEKFDNIPEYNDLSFSEVNSENKKIFSDITLDAFNDLDENDSFIDTVIECKDRDGYIAYNNNIPVGVFDYNYEDNDAFLYGVAIKSDYRGKGFGKQLIGFALYEGLKKRNKIVLDVDSNNPIAFNLYKKCGFKVDFQVDYYSFHIE
ncbi:MAG: GNAT family N-acetyltransferase [Clostridium butyricum]|nr:GNAT family N-acetyltransferase [Clostridium butyricum]